MTESQLAGSARTQDVGMDCAAVFKVARCCALVAGGWNRKWRLSRRGYGSPCQKEPNTELNAINSTSATSGKTTATIIRSK
jgi:hypothetical protein